MPVFSQHSKDQLDSCHKDLQTIFEELIKWIDFKVLEGWRSQERQYQLYRAGLSQVKWPKSKHNARTPEGKPESRAVDIAPWPIDWEELHRFVFLAGLAVMLSWIMYGEGKISHVLRWGGDWDRDNIPVYDDETEHFPDYGHFELVKP